MKKLIVLLLILVMVGVGIAFYFWNMPHQTVEGAKGQEITAEHLSRSFESDEAAANRTYLNKILSVSGTIAEVSTNQDGQTVVLLQGDSPLGGVQCTMNDVHAFTPGTKIKIKGFCHGYTLVVLLSACIVE